MKGLLRKDFYTAAKYMRSIMLLTIVFLAVSLLSEKNLFFIIFPIAIIGMLPMSLLSYDEKEKWNLYCELLPITRRQVVSSKYLVGLILESAGLLLITLILLIRTAIFHIGTFSSIIGTVSLCIAAGLMIPGVILPFIFKFGTERGRIFYYISIGFIYGLLAFLKLSNTSVNAIVALNPLALFFIITLVSITVYICSWLLSTAFYKAREL